MLMGYVLLLLHVFVNVKPLCLLQILPYVVLTQILLLTHNRNFFILTLSKSEFLSIDFSDGRGGGAAGEQSDGHESRRRLAASA